MMNVRIKGISILLVLRLPLSDYLNRIAVISSGALQSQLVFNFADSYRSRDDIIFYST
jgi:hypothetical protein